MGCEIVPEKKKPLPNILKRDLPRWIYHDMKP